MRNGIDKDVFGPLDAVPARPAGAPLRILVEGSPAVSFKGVPEALAAAAAMHEPHTVTLVCADREAAAGARGRPRRRAALARARWRPSTSATTSC